MSHLHSLSEVPPRDGRRLKQYCLHNPNCSDLRQHGDHVCVKGPKGTAVFPDRQMGSGLWHTVIKMIVAVGLGVMFFMIFVH
jgi:hypothetical protein